MCPSAASPGRNAPLLHTASSTAESERRVGACSLVVIGFFWVSGGIYGSEDLLSAGPPLVIFGFVLTVALTFALPNALMTAELATFLPADGGQVAWVYEALGSVGHHNALWVWLCNLLDAAVYPQLAASYGSHALRLDPSQSQARDAAPPSAKHAAWRLRPSRTALWAASACSIFELLLSWAVWLYSGFSSLGSMAGEVVPFAVALSVDPVRQHFTAGYFGELADSLGGRPLRAFFSAGSVASLVRLGRSVAILAAERTSLAVAAVVDARACGAALPHASPPADYPSASPAHTESRAATGAVSRLCASLVRWVRAEPPCGGAPRWAVLLNAACAFGLAQLPYSSLVEVEMTLYCASHLFFLAAFLALRVQRPHAARLFRVPGGTLAAAAYCVPPLLICVATVTANTLALRDPAATDATVALRLAALALVAASAVHLAVRRVAGSPSGSPPEDSEPAGGSEPPAARAIL
ncbi:putative cationic amino acid transporter [Emiliania huxleyi CCMP1516]|uniref:Cationic amino acid transporter n=2 Tax=Emiliania huxleyi TaxID=2903 RepID=A0A0D3J010_EMIH1|nr:putative cationic amino acid transporter [Emiliania huxleyi CCMP1516]EOD16845.1 putative cationic amino acid transporter [Emiliania huxleyi CCMP1516]|eukprot:XP_005769274.1 putative cationic amino acid transporter [Emiliania huxleyi CCMP1516]